MGLVFSELALQALHPVIENALMYEKHIKNLLNSIRNIAKKRSIDFDTLDT